MKVESETVGDIIYLFILVLQMYLRLFAPFLERAL